MKELSIEEKAKRYDEAIEIAKGYYTSDCHTNLRIAMENLFSELKESEGERIRKELIEFVKSRGGFKQEYIAWLEKQGKEIIPLKEIILNVWELGNVWKGLTKGSISTEHGTQLDYILKHWTEGDNYDKIISSKQKSAWSEEDDRKIDELIALCKGRKNLCSPTVPAYKRMDELKEWLKSLKDRVQPKQRWDEEDNKIIEEIINDIECARAINYHAPKEGYEFRENWLKSLKDRYTWKPSKEQMSFLKGYAEEDMVLQSLYNDLKKLKG